MSWLRIFLLGLTGGWWLARRNVRRSAPTHVPDGVHFDFLSLMSHELKTPINVVAGYLELLEDGVPEPLPPIAWEQVHQARLAATRLTDLVNDLLTWARLQNGREQPHFERVVAAELVEDACSTVHDRARFRGVRLETDVPPGLTLWTDRQRACQALRALVVNGVKFTEAGSVQVSVEEDGRHVRFRVRDTGIGIAPENLERVFEPYWQLEATVMRTRGGAGIGLTVARGLARILGGDVSVRSEQGSGSEFVLELARGSGPSPGPEPRSGAGSGAGGSSSG